MIKLHRNEDAKTDIEGDLRKMDTEGNSDFVEALEYCIERLSQLTDMLREDSSSNLKKYSLVTLKLVEDLLEKERLTLECSLREQGILPPLD